MCLSIFKRICHWGPLIALGIIKVITYGTTACLSVWYPPWSTYGGTFIFLGFMSSALSTLYFFLQSIFTGPGRLPKNWHPENKGDERFLQYCHTCDGYKAPRVHHCRSCNTCNMKMDHHCPWINNCVGHKNHTSFTMFVCCAVVGCSQASIIITCTLYRAFYRNWYIIYGGRDEVLISMSVWGLVGNTFILGLALGVVLAVGTLAYFQLRAILRNRTAIEDWILEKANFRRDSYSEPFVYPYDLGRWRNFKQVINWNLIPVGDGITWNIRPKCHQYTLTIEQIEQKIEKKARSREYLIRTGFSGMWFPVSNGLCACLHPPCTDEPRIRLNKQDMVVVTRWKRYWLYGERVNTNSDKQEVGNKRHRGWFPRQCAVEIMDYNEDQHRARTKKFKKTKDL